MTSYLIASVLHVDRQAGQTRFTRLRSNILPENSVNMSKAGIKQFTVVSAQGANPNQYYVKVDTPLIVRLHFGNEGRGD